MAQVLEARIGVFLAVGSRWYRRLKGQAGLIRTPGAVKMILAIVQEKMALNRFPREAEAIARYEH
jgi:hypothetical protein